MVRVYELVLSTWPSHLSLDPYANTREHTHTHTHTHTHVHTSSILHTSPNNDRHHSPPSVLPFRICWKHKPPVSLDVTTFWAKLEELGIAFTPGVSTTGVFPLLYLRGRSGVFIAVSEEESELQKVS